MKVVEKKRGLWIDHREARIVTLTGDRSELQKVTSHVEKHVRASGGFGSSTPYGPQDVVAEDRLDRKFMHHLEVYYEEVAKYLSDSEEIYIFGPAEAKQELCKHMQKSKELAQKIKAVEAADKMTDPQIVAKVKEFFGAKAPRGFV